MKTTILFWFLMVSSIALMRADDIEGHQKTPSEMIAICSIRNGKYIRAGVGSESNLAADSLHVLGWEEFQIYHFSDGTVGFRSLQNGLYMRVGFGNDVLLEVNSRVVNMREKFKLIPADDNSFAIMAVINNRYVSIGVTQQALLEATSLYVTDQEKFNFFSIKKDSQDQKNQSNNNLRAQTSFEYVDKKEDKYDLILRDIKSSSKPR